jgi:hypothetical protein
VLYVVLLFTFKNHGAKHIRIIGDPRRQLARCLSNLSAALGAVIGKLPGHVPPVKSNHVA